MARSIRRSTGDRVEIAAATAAHTVGDLVVEHGFVGLCQNTCLVGGPVVLIIAGNMHVKVPGSVTQGTKLYGAGAPMTDGALLANLTTTNLTATATSNSFVAQALTDAVGGLADIRLMPGAY